MKTGKLIGISFVITMVLILVTSGCTKSSPTPTSSPGPTTAAAPGPTTTAALKVFELSIGNSIPPEAWDNKAIYENWIKWLDKASGGRIKITLMPGGLAAGAGDLYDAAAKNIVDIGDQGIPFGKGRFVLHEVCMLPFMFEGENASWTTTMTSWALDQKYPEFQEEFLDTKILACHSVIGGWTFTKNKPVHSLEDLKGLTLIAFGRYSAPLMKLLGATPTALAPAEVYDALAKGVADGINQNVTGHMTVTKTDEVCNYATLIGVDPGTYYPVMNLKTWNSLPPDLQQLFIGDNLQRLLNAWGYGWADAERQLIGQLDKELKARGYEGVYAISDEERAKAKEIAKSQVWPLWLKEASAKVGEAKAKAILEDAEKFSQQYQFTDSNRQQCLTALRELGVAGY